MANATPRTERETTVPERTDDEERYITTITDGNRTVVGEGKTPEEAQRRARRSWEKRRKLLTSAARAAPPS